MSNTTNSLNQMPDYWSESIPVHHHQSLDLGHNHNQIQNHHQIPPISYHDTTTSGFVAAEDNNLSYDHHSYASPAYSTNIEPPIVGSGRRVQQQQQHHQPPSEHLGYSTTNQSNQLAQRSQQSLLAQQQNHTPTRFGVAATISSPPVNPAPTTRSVSRRYMTRNSQINPTNHLQVVPPTPTVTFRPLPFYDQLCEIIAPTILDSKNAVGIANESKIEFKLTVDMADLVAMNKENINIILRFCQIDLTSSLQDDNFPPDITITVNDRQIILPPAISNPNRPGVPAKRPGQHVDITRECKLCPFAKNFVHIKWYVDPTDLTKLYACTMMIGQKQTVDTLLSRIREKGLSDPETTKRIIADSDNEVATMNLQCSLLCPLGKMRLTAPCKSIKCQHIPCFDAVTYLQMNERKATWICPVCYKPAYYPDLVIDGFFADILDKTSSSITEVTLNLDGSWNPVLKMEQPVYAKGPAPEVITISDDEDD